MKITKEILNEIDHIKFGLENCDGYKIKPEDILDIWFENFEVDADGDKYTHDGRMILSKNMFKQLGDFAYDEYADGTIALDHDPEEEYYFYNRIMMDCDICQVHIVYKNGERFWFFVDYDPIYNELTGCDMDDSNCPSAELNENGDMLILFGKSSHAFHRVDNDYYSAIEGLDKSLPQKIEGILKVKITEIGNGGTSCWCPEGGLYVEMRIKNKKYSNKQLPLRFFDVSEFAFDFDLKNMGEEKFLISPTEDGRYFVQFGMLCNFYCSKIEVVKGF